MRFFFRSHKFKIILSVFCFVLVAALVAGLFGGASSPLNSVVGTVTTSVHGVFKSCENWVRDLGKKIGSNEELMLENSSLKSQVNSLTEQLTDFEKAKQENEQYQKYYSIKEQHSDFLMQPATVISRNQEDPYGSFIINKGSLQGIKKNDPVITEEGLVGYISEVNASYCKVTTVLDSAISCGGMDSRTGDTGIITGELNLAEKNKTRLTNVLRSSGVAVGDYIVTSGGGVFPAGITVGQVEGIHNDKLNTALYAEINPAVDFSELRDVMVITYFNGQGQAVSGAKK